MNEKLHANWFYCQITFQDECVNFFEKDTEESLDVWFNFKIKLFNSVTLRD